MRRQPEFPVIVGVNVIAPGAVAALDVVLLDDQPGVRPLRRRQSTAVDHEFILLGLATHDRMIFQQQARAPRTTPLAEFIGCRHPGEASADDDEVDTFVDRLP